MSSALQASVFMEQNYSDNLQSIKNTEDLTLKQMFEIAEKLTSEQSDEIYGISKVNWEHSSWSIFFGWWWRSHQSLAHKGLRILRFCLVSWNDEREPPMKHCMGTKIGVVQNISRRQKLGHNWWWANGIRVECFPRIHHIATLLQCPRVPVKNERRTRRVHKKDHLHVDVQRHLMGI